MTGVLLSTVGLAQPSRHMFGPQGGSFGRSRKCDWVLADPECILSSMHGRISLVNGTFLLFDDSTNGIFIENSREPLGRGRSVIINDGLRFKAGAYQIEARLVAAHPEQPVMRAGPFQAGPQAQSHLLPQEQQAHAALRQRTEYGDLWNAHSQDPLAYLDTPSSLMHPQPPSAPRAPVAQPILPPQAIPQAPMPRPQAMEQGYGLDTATYFPHAAPAVQPQPQPVFQPTPAPAPVWPDLNGQQAGWGAPPPISHPQPAAVPIAAPIPSAPPMVAPMPPAPLAAMPVLPAAAGKLIPDDFDPFRSLGAPLARMPAAQPPMPQTMPVAPAPFPLPEAMPPVPMPAARPAVDQLGPDLLADVVRIEPREGMNGKAVAVEKPFDPLEALKSRRGERMASLQRRAENPPQIPNPAPADMPVDVAAAVIAAMPAGVQPDDVVLHALLRGMGIDGPKTASVDAVKLAEDVGAMVKVVAEGLVQLLSARQMLKSEFRMDETQIRPEENNPFKYFKMAELVLDELFITRSGGFQPAPEAAGAAMADLQQHVMLMTSAMQRGMALMFQRLHPDAITRSSGGDGGMRIRGLGGAAKGKWETYVDNYTRMSGQIDSITKQTVSEALAQVLEERARKTSSEYWEKKS